MYYSVYDKIVILIIF